MLSRLPPKHCQSQNLALENNDLNSTLKMLGLQWHSSLDSFVFEVMPRGGPCTKRSILSEVARIFYTLGFLSPNTFIAKHLIQLVWTLGLDWDSPSPHHIIGRWERFKDELSILSKFQLPYVLCCPSVASCQLRGFYAASENGYGAVVYFRFVVDNGSTCVRLVIA